MSCLIAGDSIANNVADFARECRRAAIGGISSAQASRLLPQHLEADVVVISLGSNDLASVATKRELRLLRSKVSAQRVIWIIPAIKPRIQAIVRGLAAEHRDIVATIPALQADGVHPSRAGCEALRDLVRATLKEASR